MLALLIRFRRCRRGAAALEFALVGLLFMALVIGIIEVGRGLHMRTQISYAIDAGARTLMVKKTTTNAQVTAALKAAFHSGDPDKLTIAYSDAVVDGIPCRRVVVTYPITLLLVGTPGVAVTLKIERRIPLT